MQIPSLLLLELMDVVSIKPHPWMKCFASFWQRSCYVATYSNPIFWSIDQSFPISIPIASCLEVLPKLDPSSTHNMAPNCKSTWVRSTECHRTNFSVQWQNNRTGNWEPAEWTAECTNIVTRTNQCWGRHRFEVACHRVASFLFGWCNAGQTE